MLNVSELSKTFSRNAPKALDEVSFSVEKGEIYGLLGHNGAGKSTALGIMLGMVYPDSGDVSIGNVSIREDRCGALRKVGAIFEAPAFYGYLTGWRNLKVLTAFSGGVEKSRLLEVVEWVGLRDRIHDKVDTYSHGMRQRLALAQAMLPGPEILILDEPTDGLDPEGIVEFRDQLFELRDQFGVTILLSSHLLSEVEQVCDRVAILKGGRRVYEGSSRGLADDGIVIRLETDDFQKALEITETGFGGKKLRDDLLSVPLETDTADVLDTLVKAGVRLKQFVREEQSLERFYMDLSRKKGGEES
ncbi:MAG: ABC transporter ATP-binding protein [Verrucomicrobiales bacterium]|nr:ABC transporter ATP-binding protein [Verrucomicrobiales bacterium]